MPTPHRAAVLEALLDERIPELPGEEIPPDVAAELAGGEGGMGAGRRAQILLELERLALGRTIEWASGSVFQGDVLASFAVHCRDDLDDLEVVADEATRLLVRWRDEVSRFELRNGFLGVRHLVSDTPTMLLGDVGEYLDGLVADFVEQPELRSQLAIWDLGRLERLGTVRSSAFVYFEWFLRDEYGVKVVPSPAFTRGLIDRGVISLGMG